MSTAGKALGQKLGDGGLAGGLDAGDEEHDTGAALQCIRDWIGFHAQMVAGLSRAWPADAICSQCIQL